MTQQYNEIIKMYTEGFSLRKIEKLTGINRKKISRILKSNGIIVKKGMSNEDIAQAKIMLEKGMKITYISQKLNIDRHTISKTLKKMNIRKPQNYKRNIEYDETILKLYNQKNSIEKISTILNISTNIVWNCLVEHDYKVNHYSKYTLNKDAFKIIDTEEKAYWLGFLYADGYVNDAKGLELTLAAKDLEHIKEFRKFMQSDSNITFQEATNSYRLCLYSIELAKDLTRLGCYQNKSLTLKFPTEDQVPSHLIHHFMRGYFDGDGCISQNKKQKVFSVIGTSDFLDKYEEILLTALKKDTRNKRYKQGQAFSIVYGGNLQVNKIYNYLYNKATIFLKRKQQKFAVLG